MYVPFLLLSYLIGQNLTPKDAIHVLIPVMSSLRLVCKPLIDFLLVAATYNTNNGLPITLQDDRELGVEPPLRLFEVTNLTPNYYSHSTVDTASRNWYSYRTHSNPLHYGSSNIQDEICTCRRQESKTDQSRR